MAAPVFDAGQTPHQVFIRAACFTCYSSHSTIRTLAAGLPHGSIIERFLAPASIESLPNGAAFATTGGRKGRFMCFSPSASFAAGAALAGIGIASLRKTETPRERALASVPLLFAVQQLLEGLLWLCLLHGYSERAQYWLTQLYSGFAGIVWPLIIPVSLYLIESSRQHRRLIAIAGAIGAGVAGYTALIMLRFGFTAEILSNCIFYDNPLPAPPYAVTIYAAATCAGFFCSSRPFIRWLGVINVAAFLAAYYFYRVNLVSVWCFFAAIVSGLIYAYFTHAAPLTPPEKQTA